MDRFFSRKMLFFGSIIFLLFYTAFWAQIFLKGSLLPSVVSPIAKANGFLQSILPISNEAQVLGQQSVSNSIDTSIPSSYLLSITPRKQVFNLSCEFAAAATILFALTQNPEFAPGNEEAIEKMLIAQIGVSQNPNIGVRMGDQVPTSSEVLLQNLDKKFGGENYYGVHAPPFIDLFAKYHLAAIPLAKNASADLIKQAIANGHLIMAWIKVGYGQIIDVQLSYGQVPVVKGEHTLVIYGYENEWFWVMDPASGAKRRISQTQLLASSSYFTMPFLEVYPAAVSSAQDVVAPSFLVDNLTGLNRNALKVSVTNASAEPFAGETLAQILSDFGYHVVSLDDKKEEIVEDVWILLKESKIDYQKLLQRDLRLASYHVASMSALSENSPEDVRILVGQQ